MRILLALLIGWYAASPAAAEITLKLERASNVDLNNPHDVKLTPDGKYLTVSDVGNNRVVMLDPETLEFRGSFGSDHQAGTHDVDFDAAGRAYVADTHNNRVTIYRLDGLEAELIGELSERIRGPEGVLAHPNGRIYVAGAWSGNLVVYDNGEIVAELGGLSSPHDVELDVSGNIWLADAGNDRLLLLTPDLEILEELAGLPYDFNGVRYLDLTPEGVLFAADKNNHQIKIIAPDRSIMRVMGDGKPGRGDGRFRTPEGVEIRGSTLWLADSGNHRILKYSFEIN